MMDNSFSDEFGYMTVPTSVASSCNKEMCFYSAPTSPSRLKLSALSGYQTGHTTPRTHEDANSNLDEFEFETSRRFNSDLDTETSQKESKDDNKPCYGHDHMQEQQQRPCRGSLPTMAFADELFSDGKVLPLMPPLKLPPRLLQNGDCSIMISAQSSTLTSPRSPGLMLRLPFLRHSLWNDDFDPFMVALEKVKGEKRGNSKAKHGHRRTRSLSPFRGFNNRSEKHAGLSKTKQQPESHCCGPGQVICELQKEPLLKQASGRVDMLSEPKGLVFGREVRLVGVSNDATFEPKRASVPKVAMETKKDESKRGGFWSRKKKRENMVKFLFGNAYMGKASGQHKLDDQKAALEKPASMSKLEMNSVNSSQSTQWDKGSTKGDMNRMRLVCHKPRGPRLLLCLGHDGGYVK